ncbi:MAG: right-handed parallel beta-helix repeat-containing protein [Sphingomonas phyllosphaerae]
MDTPLPHVPASPGRVALAALLTTCCAPTPSHSAPTDWAALATAARQSPVSGDGVRRSWNGADGGPVTVTVLAPRLDRRPVIALDPVPGDNGPAIAAALARLRAAGGGTLRLAPGTWPIAAGPPGLSLDGLDDVLIDGPGAQLVFAQWGDGILLSNVARVMLRGLSVGYAQPPVVAARVSGGRLVFAGAAPAPGTPVYQVSARGPTGARRLLGRHGQPLGADGALPGALDDFAPDTPVQVKLGWYRGGAIRIGDPGDVPVSHDITLDHVTVRDSAGSGVTVDFMDRGLAIVGARLGGAGGSAIAYDGIHVTAAGGDLLVENSDFTGMGDDAINIATPIIDAGLDPDGRTLTLSGVASRVAPGTRLALFDAGLRLLGTASVATRTPRDSAGRVRATLVAPVPAGAVRYARHLGLLSARYAIVGNRIADCLCHGVLAQAPNGLVRDNRFTGLRYNAIRLLTSAAWKEGTGAFNVVVADNRIEDTGQDNRAGRVWAAITVFAELEAATPGGPAPLAAEPLNAGLLIRDNQIDAVDQGCIAISNATDVTLRNNRCTRFGRRPATMRMLADRDDVSGALARLPARGAYLAGGNGLWIDATTSARIAIEATR